LSDGSAPPSVYEWVSIASQPQYHLSGVLSCILFEASVSSFASTARTLPFLASAFALSCLIVDHRLSTGQYYICNPAERSPTYVQTVVAPTVIENVDIAHTVA